MKSIRVTFRLTAHQLARGLQIIKQHDPTYKLISINSLIKTIYQDYLAQMTLDEFAEVPASILEEIIACADKSSETKLTIEDLMNIEKIRRN